MSCKIETPGQGRERRSSGIDPGGSHRGNRSPAHFLRLHCSRRVGSAAHNAGSKEGPLKFSVLGGESLGCDVDRGIMKGDSMKAVLVCDHRSGSFQPLLRVK